MMFNSWRYGAPRGWRLSDLSESGSIQAQPLGASVWLQVSRPQEHVSPQVVLIMFGTILQPRRDSRSAMQDSFGTITWDSIDLPVENQPSHCPDIDGAALDEIFSNDEDSAVVSNQ